MDWPADLVWNGKLLGIDWSVWKVVGWLGNVVFFSRWWLSLVGSLLLLIYSLRQRDSVFIFAYAFTWIPYIRNLIIHHRHVEAHLECPRCGRSCPPPSNFCSACGTALAAAPVKATP
jgi:lipid-A-disaccharide synthase-like uncharacterized protein